MKFDVSIEIDWINEEENLDEIMKDRIISTISEKALKSIDKDIVKKAEEAITQKTDEIIEKKVTEIFDEFVANGVAIYDSYGDQIKSFTSVKEMVKDRFDKFLTEKVDSSGKPSKGYGTKGTRVDYMINTQIKQFADDFTKKTVKEVNEIIKTTVSEGLSAKIGGELMKVLKVDEMIGGNNIEFKG